MENATAHPDPATCLARRLWDDHLRSPCDASRNALIEHYLPLVRGAAVRLACRNGRRPHPGDVDDLMQYGVFGLRDAIRGFDPSRGIRFETYCLQRVRGAMLDGLKAGQWMPRDIRQQVARLSAVRESLEAGHGAGCHALETAARLGIAEEQVHALHVHASRMMIGSLQACDEEGEEAGTRLADHREEEAPVALQRQDVRDLFMRELTRSERHLLMLYYYDNLTMREVGDVLGLSGTRVSQLHTEIVRRLRERLAERMTDHAGRVRESLDI